MISAHLNLIVIQMIVEPESIYSEEIGSVAGYFFLKFLLGNIQITPENYLVCDAKF